MTPSINNDVRFRFVTSNTLTAKDELLAFVDYLGAMIEEVPSSPFFDPFAEDSFTESLSQSSLDDLRDRIRNANEREDEALVQHGLVGDQLQMKREIVTDWDRRYRQHRGRRESRSGWGGFASRVSGAVDFVVRRSKPEGEVLAKILEGLKSILGSVLDAFHIKGPLKELVEFLATCVSPFLRRWITSDRFWPI